MMSENIKDFGVEIKNTHNEVRDMRNLLRDNQAVMNNGINHIKAMVFVLIVCNLGLLFLYAIARQML